MLKKSLQLYDMAVKKLDTERDMYSGPLFLQYKATHIQVGKISSLTSPISYAQFLRQCRADTPWEMEPDICLKIRVIPDLEYVLQGTNILYEPFAGERSIKGVVSVRGVRDQKKTWLNLCTRCGNYIPAGMGRDCPCGRARAAAGSSSSKPVGKKVKVPARVRRCGCKVGSKCPH